VLHNDLFQRLSVGLESLLIEEWGGTKSPLAQVYIKETIIPDLVHSLTMNYCFMQNRICASILANKFQTQHGYPEAFSQGISGDVLRFASRLLAELRIPLPETALREPWEKLFRILSLGVDIPAIAMKIGYAEDHIELIKKNVPQN